MKANGFENNVGKGENAGNQHFLLFPQCFLINPKQTSLFESHLFCRPKMLEFGSGLKFLLGKELTAFPPFPTLPYERQIKPLSTQKQVYVDAPGEEALRIQYGKKNEVVIKSIFFFS